MRRNLITRLGAAAGVVAFVVATIFILLLQAVERVKTGSPAEVSRAADHAQVYGIVGLVGCTLLLLALTAYLARFIVIPLRSVTNAAEEMAEGNLSVRVPEEGDAEPMALAQAFNEMASSLQAEQRQTASALAQLDAEKRRIETFHRAGEQMAAARDLSELAVIALLELASAAGASNGALWAVEAEARGALVLEARLEGAGSPPPAVLRPGVGPAGRAFAEQQVIPSLQDGVAGLHLPLIAGRRVLGVMSLERADGPAFDLEARDTLDRLADQVAVALSNAILLRSTVRAARVNRAVLDATPDPVGLLDLEGFLMAHNAPMADVWTKQGGVDAPGVDPERESRDPVTLDDRAYSRYAGPVRDEAGELMGRLVVLRDVTLEREAEKLKDEFFALVSHELRTPLTSILGYLELMEDDRDAMPADAKRFLEIIQRNATRLLRLVGDMLFVAQVEAGRMSLTRSPMDLETVVQESVEAARPIADRAGVVLTLRAATVGRIDGDRDRIGQLVDNLVSNAVKFTPTDGEVRVILTSPEPGFALVEVADDGMGIPEGEQAQLFERFFRSTAATTQAVPGAGLGLTIAKTIAEAHEGEISLRSTEGVGTTVAVKVPLLAE